MDKVIFDGLYMNMGEEEGEVDFKGELISSLKDLESVGKRTKN